MTTALSTTYNSFKSCILLIPVNVFYNVLCIFLLEFKMIIQNILRVLVSNIIGALC